jgi:hypothetical protein
MPVDGLGDAGDLWPTVSEMSWIGTPLLRPEHHDPADRQPRRPPGRSRCSRPADAERAVAPWVPRRRGCRSPNGAASPRSAIGPRAAPPAAEFPALCRVLRPERKLQGQVRGRFLPGGGRATTRCTGSQGGVPGRGTYSRALRHCLAQAGDSRLIHSRGTPQSRAAPANYGHRPTEAVPNRAQHPQHDGSSAAARAGSRAGIVSNGSPGSHTGRVSPHIPRSNPFHGRGADDCGVRRIPRGARGGTRPPAAGGGR